MAGDFGNEGAEKRQPRGNGLRHAVTTQLRGLKEEGKIGNLAAKKETCRRECREGSEGFGRCPVRNPNPGGKSTKEVGLKNRG